MSGVAPALPRTESLSTKEAIAHFDLRFVLGPLGREPLMIWGEAEAVCNSRL